jgi:vacuolar-type H+-ATPase subunit I/STV1
MNSPFLVGIAAVIVAFSAVAIYYITVLKNGFAGLRRLERPWLVLECGVASLIVAALTVPWPGVLTSTVLLHLVQIVAVVVAAFFILTAMAMMKQAWTIKEGD